MHASHNILVLDIKGYHCQCCSLVGGTQYWAGGYNAVLDRYTSRCYSWEEKKAAESER